MLKIQVNYNWALLYGQTDKLDFLYNFSISI